MARRFGSTAQEHRRRARMDAAVFRDLASVTRRNLDAGECHRALLHLKGLLRAEGAFHANRAGYSGRTFPRTGGTIKQLETLTRRFAATCLVKG